MYPPKYTTKKVLKIAPQKMGWENPDGVAAAAAISKECYNSINTNMYFSYLKII